MYRLATIVSRSTNEDSFAKDHLSCRSLSKYSSMSNTGFIFEGPFLPRQSLQFIVTVTIAPSSPKISFSSPWRLTFLALAG